MTRKFVNCFLLLLFLYPQLVSANFRLNTEDKLRRKNYQNGPNELVKTFYSDLLLLNVDSNRVNLKKTLELCKRNGDLRAVVDIYNLLGDYYSRLSLNDSTLEYYKKALELGCKVDYNTYFPSITQKIATKYWDKGSYNQALENALLLKNFYEKENTIEDKESVVNLLGIIYLRLQDYPIALQYLQHAAKISERKKNLGMLGVIYSNIGGLYFKQEKYVEALEFYEKGVNLEIDNKQFLNAGRSFESIAKVYLALDNPKKAEDLLEKALTYNQRTSDIVGFTRTYVTYGRLFNYLKKYTKAIEYLKKAEEFALKTDSKEYYMNSCEQLLIAYQNVNDYKTALYYQGKYLTLYKQIYSIQDFAGIMKLESDLKIEKKNNELNKFMLGKQRTVLLLMIVVVLLSCVISILFIALYNRTNKSKKLLIAMNAEISIQKDNLQRINIELEEARISAVNANELKAHFLKNISHEIRTPLNGIVGLSELIVSENTPSAINQNYLKLIKNSSNRLLYTIDNIVDLAHITTNQVNPHISTFDAVDLVEEVYQAYVPFVDNCENKIYFKCFCESNLKRTIQSDRALVKKILVQLLDNAIKFTPEGHVTIGCDQKDLALRFFVRDTGVGISENSRKLIFESFRQEQDSLTREYEGVGIGLTIANKLSEFLSADLYFESKKDQGTTFYLCIQSVVS